MKKTTDILQIISVSVTVLVLGAAFFLLPDRAISYRENRVLADAPAFTAQKLLSGEYTAALGGYYADQFPARDAFVALKAYAELALGKGENNGVIYADGDTLIARPQTLSFDDALDSAEVFGRAVELPVTVVALPRTVDVFADRLPLLYARSDDRAQWQDFTDAIAARGMTAPDLYTPLVQSGEYYRTDHHYTTRGAYLTYCLLADSLGYEPYDESYFCRETGSDDFEGTSMRSSGFYLAARDRIELWRYAGDTDYSVCVDGEKITLYDLNALDGVDQYAVFLGGNHARVDISGTGERPKLLIIRDSYADALAPFLALHYDLTMIDLRYYHGNVQKLARDGYYAQVLFLMSINEYGQGGNFSYLRIPFDRSEP